MEKIDAMDILVFITISGGFLTGNWIPFGFLIIFMFLIAIAKTVE